MRFAMLMVSLFIPVLTFALSCPNNGRILDTGYSLQRVLEYCGQPLNEKRYMRTTNLVEEWTYYKSGMNNSNIRVKILMRNNNVSNISVLENGVEQNLQSSGICGVMLQTGEGSNRVISVCGYPVTKQVLENSQVEKIELTYPGVGYRVLVLTDGVLTSWAYPNY